MRSWLLESIALELHLLTDEQQYPRAARLLDILYGSIDTNADRGGEDGMDDQFFAGGEVQIQAFTPGQSLMRILEIFQSFDLIWQDATVSQEDVTLYFFASLDYSSCLRVAESGAEIIDRDALINLLSNLRQSRQDSDALAADAQVQLSKEVRYLLESCVRENNRREIEHAKSMGFEAWRRVINISLSKCFDRLPIDGREGILFDLLQEVPPVIRRPSLGIASATLLSEVTVMLITKLREDRSQRILVQSLTEENDSTATSLPEDRSHKLLSSLVECVFTPGMPEVVRGNLYASIINHLQLVQTIAKTRRRDSLVHDDLEEEPLFGSSTDMQAYSSLEIGCINIVNTQAERLIPVICRDAIDGSEVWKTVAFTLLDSLVRLSRIQRQHRILHLLARGGYLSNFCVGFKEADEDLQAVLNPEPGTH
jgi:nuclear pore complex protein Nup205